MTAIGIGISLAIGSGAGGTVLGPETITNGNFAASGANWNVANADGTHIITFGVGSCRYQSDTTSPILQLTQANGMTIGAQYRVVINVSSYTSGSIIIPGMSATSMVVGAAGTFSATVQAPSVQFLLQRNSTNVDLSMSSISVKQVLA